MQRCHRRAKPNIENLVMWFLRYASEQTDRQTEALIAIFHSPTGTGRIRNNDMDKTDNLTKVKLWRGFSL